MDYFAGLSGRPPAHYPMLKNSEIERPRESRFRARRVISTDSRHDRAYRRLAGGKTDPSAEPLRNFPSSLSAVL